MNTEPASGADGSASGETSGVKREVGGSSLAGDFLCMFLMEWGAWCFGAEWVFRYLGMEELGELSWQRCMCMCLFTRAQLIRYQKSPMISNERPNTYSQTTLAQST